MGIVMGISGEKSFVGRWKHKLFKCPTFWRWKRAFECPECGKKYRCYWDGNDAGGMIDLCDKCAEEYES